MAIGIFASAIQKCLSKNRRGQKIPGMEYIPKRTPPKRSSGLKIHEVKESRVKKTKKASSQRSAPHRKTLGASPDEPIFVAEQDSKDEDIHADNILADNDTVSSPKLVQVEVPIQPPQSPAPHIIFKRGFDLRDYIAPQVQIEIPAPLIAYAEIARIHRTAPDMATLWGRLRDPSETVYYEFFEMVQQDFLQGLMFMVHVSEIRKL